MRILVVEDEPLAADVLARGLREHAYAVDVADDGADAVEQAGVNDYDLAILDVLLPGMNGLDVCRQLRAQGATLPILMLTARAGLDQRVEGLDAGADDYLAKPYHFPELLARVRALLRRGPALAAVVLRVADLTIDTRARRVCRGEREIALTAKEYALLEYLTRRAGEVVGRADIAEHVWDDSFDPISNLIEVYIQRLRRKVDDGHANTLIQTRRGAGYVLTAGSMTFSIETVRTRLTLWYVAALATTVLVVGGLIYVLLARALYTRIDDNLHDLVQIATTSLANDLAEGQDAEDAARSTADELSARRQMLAIYDANGRLLAEGGRDRDLQISLPALTTIPSDRELLATIAEANDPGDRHRVAFQHVTIERADTRYIVAAAISLEATDEELASLGRILAYVVPIALAIAGIGGWFLARRSLSPVVAMAERARRIGVENLSERLPVANPHDELGKLAGTFNELLARLEASLNQQREFMTDASHELRTPVTTARAAANVALQQPHRDEPLYRETLAIIEQQTARLSRIVDDMFTMARADAGNYPVHRTPMYLDEVVDEVVRAARVLATPRGVAIEPVTMPSASFHGDEELIRRLLVNLVDNAVRHAPSGTTVRAELAPTPAGYAIAISDEGPGIPAEKQARIFERFYRADAARGRGSDGGAGLGLALARWIAGLHGGDVSLTRSSHSGTTFTVILPARGAG